MDKFYELAKARFSTRAFDGRRVEEDKLNAILETGRIAPTAKNLQPQRIYVLESDSAIEKVNKISPCIYGTKTVLLICYDKNEAYPGCGDIDCAIVLTHMVLQAQSLGVDSCIVKRFDHEEIKNVFNLPENIVPSLLLPLGYGVKENAPGPNHDSIKEISETVVRL